MYGASDNARDLIVAKDEFRAEAARKVHTYVGKKEKKTMKTRPAKVAEWYQEMVGGEKDELNRLWVAVSREWTTKSKTLPNLP